MIMQHRRHNYDRRKLSCSERYMSQGGSVHNKSHTDGARIEQGLSRLTGRQSSCLPELGQGLED